LEELIFQNMIFAGGPPRGGTTLLARLLNSHPEICTHIDNNVYECWRLYYYRNRTGLIKLLRTNEINGHEVKKYLADHIISDGYVSGLALSNKIKSMPPAPDPVRPDGEHLSETEPVDLRSRLKNMLATRIRRKKDKKEIDSASDPVKQRRVIPAGDFIRNYRLCLKSPEVVFVLKPLAEHFPDAKFVISYRPIMEIAESMYRKGFEWNLPSYHRRWRVETDANGEAVAPPGVPEEWCNLWKSASDFERCVIYATSYMRAIAENIPTLSSEKVLVYDHKKFRSEPESVTSKLSSFLGLQHNFEKSFFINIKNEEPTICGELKNKYKRFLSSLDVETWHHRVGTLSCNSRFGMIF